MAETTFTCEHCGASTSQPRSAVNQARRHGKRLFCNRTCAGLARRKDKTDSQKRAEKAEYDCAYRVRDPEGRKQKKAAYFRATYDPVVAAEQRQRKMPRHVAYCRRPEYRAWKQQYDRQKRASEFGVFADAYLATLDVIREVNARMSRTELYATKGTQNKSLNRRRDYERLIRNDA